MQPLRQRPTSEIYQLSIPDVVGAQSVQLGQINNSLGQYRLGSNDCITACMDVLRAGGLNPPAGGGNPYGGFNGTAVHEWLESIGVKILR